MVLNQSSDIVFWRTCLLFQVGINKKYPKREVNIRKDENMSHIVKKVVTKTNTNATKNIGVQNKTVTGINMQVVEWTLNLYYGSKNYLFLTTYIMCLIKYN